MPIKGTEAQLVDLIADNVYYHWFSILIFAIIVISIVINKRGSKNNLKLAAKYEEIMRPSLKGWFSQYDGDLVMESPNLIKLYASGRDSCLFAIMAFAVRTLFD